MSNFKCRRNDENQSPNHWADWKLPFDLIFGFWAAISTFVFSTFDMVPYRFAPSLTLEQAP